MVSTFSLLWFLKSYYSVVVPELSAIFILEWFLISVLPILTLLWFLLSVTIFHSVMVPELIVAHFNSEMVPEIIVAHFNSVMVDLKIGLIEVYQGMCNSWI